MIHTKIYVFICIKYTKNHPLLLQLLLQNNSKPEYITNLHPFVVLLTPIKKYFLCIELCIIARCRYPALCVLLLLFLFLFYIFLSRIKYKVHYIPGYGVGCYSDVTRIPNKPKHNNDIRGKKISNKQ